MIFVWVGYFDCRAVCTNFTQMGLNGFLNVQTVTAHNKTHHLVPYISHSLNSFTNKNNSLHFQKYLRTIALVPAQGQENSEMYRVRTLTDLCLNTIAKWWPWKHFQRTRCRIQEMERGNLINMTFWKHMLQFLITEFKILSKTSRGSSDFAVDKSVCVCEPVWCVTIVYFEASDSVFSAKFHSLLLFLAWPSTGQQNKNGHLVDFLTKRHFVFGLLQSLGELPLGFFHPFGQAILGLLHFLGEAILGLLHFLR